jgi:hypothetical protein
MTDIKHPLIMLTTMRSYSSVACGMIGQHPELYGLPEVNLFIADRVSDLLDIHKSRPHGIHGLLRTIAQLHDGAQTDETIENAREWLNQHASWETKQVFDHILAAVEPRMAVDKSPRTALQPAFLQRAYAMYPDALFLHLTRHPRSMGNSLLANLKKNHEWGGTFRSDSTDPEQVWLRCQENILDFATSLAEGQYMHIKGEELLSRPELYMPQIAEWLDIDASQESIEAMLHPETSPYANLGPENARMGNDPEFLENPELRRNKVMGVSLAGGLEWAPQQQFSKRTVKLAKQLGYT